MTKKAFIDVENEISGSDKEKHNEKMIVSDVDIKVTKFHLANQEIIIPFEEWPLLLSKEDIKLHKEYEKTQYPDLFKMKHVKDDKTSEIPELVEPKQTKFFSSILSAAVSSYEKTKKEAKKNIN